ncbi:DUF6232 family protein [Streptomyces sp. T21Q-yed]|nr:DUF6232 family protein [Streptomyces sp. T21Q-yed]MDF3143868.1 DUF6232 family protein [Streptomyces sp. T21Q-yed]WDF44765.1 DUF6232 family protein [Streptomyces sp. T12]
MEMTEPTERPWNTPPDIPPLPPPLLRGAQVDLRVDKRLLWVGRAAYPLANITRVYTYTLHPRRMEATVRFFKNIGIILSIAFALTILGAVTTLGSESAGSGIITFVWIAAAAALIYCVGQLISVLSAQSYYVLAAETSGPSMAVVTSSNPAHLDQLVGYIVNAIENPEAEFQVTVESITVSPRHYHFGDNVNMYGGTGNVGISA